MNYPIDYVPTQEDKKFAENNLELARLIAAAELPQLLTRLVKKAHDDTSSAKQIQDAAEFAYKVSGLAKRQEETDDRGRFVFNINFSNSGATLTVAQSKVIDVEPIEKSVNTAVSETSMIDTLPTDVVEFTDDLDFQIDEFDD